MDTIVLNYDHIIADVHSTIVEKAVTGPTVSMLIMRQDCEVQKTLSFELIEDKYTVAELLTKV